MHVQVGGFDVRDPLLDEAWGALADAGTPVVVHAGSGPVGTEFTGPGPVAELLARHPRLRLVVAHTGAPEYAEFLELAERHERVAPRHHDGVHRLLRRDGRGVPARAAAPAARPRAGRKVLLGSDFPNIPYPYAHQLEALSGSASATTGCGRSVGERRGLLGDRPDAGNRRGRASRYDTGRLRRAVRLTTQEGLIGFDLGR